MVLLMMNLANSDPLSSAEVRSLRSRGRILIVEDNYLAACALSDWLVGWGYEIVGPVGSKDEAQKLAEDPDLTGAILDISIHGGTSADVADVLDRHKTPYIFVTGYAQADLLPPRFASQRLLRKPIDEDSLRRAVNAEFGEVN